MKRFDYVNEVVLPLIGATILFWLWYSGVIPFDIIKAILTEDL